MNNGDMNFRTTSMEFSVDVAMEDIVAKVAAGTASAEDQAKLGQLSARRVRLMRRPSGFTGRRRATA